MEVVLGLEMWLWDMGIPMDGNKKKKKKNQE